MFIVVLAPERLPGLSIDGCVQSVATLGSKDKAKLIQHPHPIEGSTSLEAEGQRVSRVRESFNSSRRK